MTPYYQDATVTIYHGDATGMTLPGDVIVTDPPYGKRRRSGRGGPFNGRDLVTGDRDTSARDAVLGAWAGPALVFGTWQVPRPELVRTTLVWEKGLHVGSGDLSLPWKANWEEIYVIGGGWIGRRTSSVLRVNAISPNFATRLHPTEKPIDLMRALVMACPPDWTILDPFAGSGSTLVAAKQLNRHAIGIEIEERYCEIAALRCSQEVLGLGDDHAA